MEVTPTTPMAPEYPRIETYRCYRRFLAAYYTYKKALRAGFSYRQFSTLAGLKSPNYLQLVTKGERNLSEETAEAVARAMKLTEFETSYFLSLVRQENAKTEDELREAEREGLAALKMLLSKQIPSLHAEILSKWHHMVIREMVFLTDFEPSGSYVEEKTRGLISRETAQLSIDFLIKSGFLVQVDGRWSAADPVLDTGDEMFTHEWMQMHHTETLKFWSEHLTELFPKQQELGVLNIPIASNKIPELKKRIRRFQDEVIGWLQSETEADSIVQLGTYLMPLVLPDSPLKPGRKPPKGSA